MALTWDGNQTDVEGCNFGPLAVIFPLLQRMKIAEIINQPCPADPQAEFDHGRVLSLLMAARLYSPVALQNVAAWAAESGADILWGIPVEKLNDDRLARSLDALFRERHSVAAHVALHVSREFEVLRAGLKTPIAREHKASNGSGAVFLRLGETNGPPKFGVFLALQNPFLKWERKDGQVAMAYAPDMEWRAAYGPFESDRVCLGLYELSGVEFPAWNQNGRLGTHVQRIPKRGCIGRLLCAAGFGVACVLDCPNRGGANEWQSRVRCRSGEISLLCGCKCGGYNFLGVGYIWRLCP